MYCQKNITLKKIFFYTYINNQQNNLLKNITCVIFSGGVLIHIVGGLWGFVFVCLFSTFGFCCYFVQCFWVFVEQLYFCFFVHFFILFVQLFLILLLFCSVFLSFCWTLTSDSFLAYFGLLIFFTIFLYWVIYGIVVVVLW